MVDGKDIMKLLLRKTDALRTWFSKFKKSVTRSVFGKLQLKQISLNFKTCCCNLKISCLGAKACLAFFVLF